MTSLLHYYFCEYPSYILAWATCPNSFFGCCDENVSKCAELYWAACCPCRCAFGIAFGALGGLCDLCTLPCHCCGNQKYLQCTQEWCGCQYLPGNRRRPESTLFVSTDDIVYANAVSIDSFSQLLYFVCCVHGSCHYGKFVKHCPVCEPGSRPAAPAPPPPPISVVSRESRSTQVSVTSVSPTMSRGD
jgi:hypothetical protein